MFVWFVWFVDESISACGAQGLTGLRNSWRLAPRRPIVPSNKGDS